MVNALLVRVGADRSIGGGSWNGPIDTQSRTFAYVPIPETVARQSGWKRCGEQDGQFGGRDERDDCRAATVTQAIFS